ncbi:MAG: hypothetical protein R3A10_02995 [Caldilineaceae bacterium]
MSDADFPAIRLKPGRDKPVRQGHPWIFTGAVRHMPDAPADGGLVDVVDAGGTWLARGYLNRRSQICVRLLSWERETPIDTDFWRTRLTASVALRALTRPGTRSTGWSTPKTTTSPASPWTATATGW